MMKMIKNIIFNSDKERLTDRAFKQSITISVVGILLCMIALCSATWAWFSGDVSSAANQIHSAHCDMSVSVTDNSTAPLSTSEGKYTLKGGKDYIVTISASGSAKSAYCILVVNGEQHYTTQIFTSVESELTFTLRFSEDKDIEIITCWGTSSKPETERSFENGGYYYNLQKSEPITITDDTNPNTETASSEINSNTETSAKTESVAQSNNVTQELKNNNDDGIM